MSHWIVALIILPGLVAPVIALAMRYDLVLQRVFSLASTVALVVMAAALYASAATGVIESYELGAWPAPFGIVLVLDRLSGMMVLLTAVLALVVLAYAVASGWDARGRHFHALYQFQLMGLFGAMLTGDVFNLFVFFEILLIASYGLMIHGGGRMRLRGGVQYVIYNLAGSTLFLFALGTVYGVLGTLNMADMAVRAAELPAGDTALLRVAAALLLLVFVLKGALLPLHFWLPNTYALAPAPVAALFAIMTKVGAYAVIRVYTLVFHPGLEATGSMASDAIIPAALITLVVGMIGVLAGGTMARVVAFAAIGSMGTLFLAIGAFTPQATAAALYYLIHSTLAAAVLFLIVDQLRARRGNTALVALPPMAQNGLIAALFFGGAIAMAGMPPLSGFIGKLLVMDALRDHALWVWIWAAILVTSLIAVVGFARAGSMMFWKAEDATTQPVAAEPEARVNAIADHAHPGAALASIGALLGLIIALTVLAGPVMRHAEAAAEQLHERNAYIVAVLGAAEVLDPLTAEPMAQEGEADTTPQTATDEEEG
ncbi:monovalent cation/H+ antiporter subunit D [Pararhodobacter sp.]|uniref:monovalent cation/H+ antiporter subunit D n=1 Tax=Pararhodobacter sp. TaxID=2127056 RepID=UPI002FDEBF2B